MQIYFYSQVNCFKSLIFQPSDQIKSYELQNSKAKPRREKMNYFLFQINKCTRSIFLKSRLNNNKKKLIS